MVIVANEGFSSSLSTGPSVCLINLHSMYWANIYWKEFHSLQSATNHISEELGLKPNCNIHFTHSIQHILYISLVSSVRGSDNNRITYLKWGSMEHFYNAVIFFCILIFISFLILPMFYSHFLRAATEEMSLPIRMTFWFLFSAKRGNWKAINASKIPKLFLP